MLEGNLPEFKAASTAVFIDDIGELCSILLEL